jgi:hypothetical protein
VLLIVATIKVLSCVTIDWSQVVQIVPIDTPLNLFVAMIKTRKKVLLSKIEFS